MDGQVRIDQMFAFILLDDDNTEGIPAFHRTDGMAMPMVGADMTRVESLRGMAVHMARLHKKKVTLVKFTKREELEVFEP